MTNKVIREKDYVQVLLGATDDSVLAKYIFDNTDTISDDEFISIAESRLNIEFNDCQTEYHRTLYSCDDLIDYLVDESGAFPTREKAVFRGALIEVDGFIPDTSLGSYIITSCKYPGVIWIVGRIGYTQGMFLLSVVHTVGMIDQLPSVLLPESIREELIATLKGNL